MYIRMMSKKEIEADFDIQYVLDGGSFLLVDGRQTKFPYINHKAPPIKFLYESPKIINDSPVKTFLNSRYQAVKALVKIKDSSQPAEYVMEEKSCDFAITSVYSEVENHNFNLEELKKLQNPVFYISLLADLDPYMDWFLVALLDEHKHKIDKTGKPYSYGEDGEIEFSTSHLTLYPSTLQEVNLTKGRWAFFKIHNTRSKSILVNSFTREGGKFALYITRAGQVPTETNYLIKSKPKIDPHLRLNGVHLKSGELLVGDFVLGIRCVKDGSLAVEWMNSDNNMLVLKLGQPRTLKASSYRPNYLQVP